MSSPKSSFLSATKTITGSYSHLPTLFFSDSADDVKEKFAGLGIPVHHENTVTDDDVNVLLAQHFTM